MMPMLSKISTIITLCVLCLLPSRASAAVSLDEGWLAFGELRGYLEPCGCDPATDLGGLRRLHASLGRERALTPLVPVFDLGNNLPRPEDKQSHKIEFLIEGVAAMQPVASLFSRLELRNADLIKHSFAVLPSQKRLNYVLSNLRKPVKGVAEIVRSAGFDVFGYVDAPESADKLARYSPALLRHWQKLSAGKKRRVLLFAGDDKALVKIAASGFFELIISAGRLDLDAAVNPDARADESLLVRNAGETAVMRVPVGGQGILRGGKKRQQEAKSLLGSLPSAACDEPFGCQSSSEPAPLLPSLGKMVTWLSPDVGGEKDLAEFFSRYNDKASKLFAEASKERLAALATTPYAGAEACKSCHASAYEVWAKSAHAKAIKTLEYKGKARDPECVTCHVLGYEKSGGFVDMEHSPQFANVSCENCHGPRLAHTKNPAISPEYAPASETCVSCHNSLHSPAFNYETYWPQIKHGK